MGLTRHFGQCAWWRDPAWHCGGIMVWTVVLISFNSTVPDVTVVAMYPFAGWTILNRCGILCGIQRQWHHIRLLLLRANFAVETLTTNNRLRPRPRLTRSNNRTRCWINNWPINPGLISSIFNSWFHTNILSQHHLQFQAHHQFNQNQQHPLWHHQANRQIHHPSTLTRCWTRCGKP